MHARRSIRSGGELGEPYVYDYEEGDAESAMQAVRRVLSWNDGRGFALFPLPDLSVCTDKLARSPSDSAV